MIKPLRHAAGLALLLGLTGCQLAPVVASGAAGLEPFRTETETAAVRDVSVAAADLDRDPIYQLLVAEFAGKRDQLPLAVTHYLAMAEQTRDRDIVERAARIAVYADDNDAALKASRLWVAVAPENLDARQLLAASLIRSGDGAAALEHLKYVLAKDRSNDGNRFRAIANLLGSEADRQVALSVMEALVATRAGDTDAQVAYALLAMRAENLPKAQEAMERLVSKTDINPNLALAYVALLQKQGKAAVGVNFLERALKRAPEDLGLRLLYARLLADDRQFEAARRQFALLERKAPDNADVLYALGLLNLQANKVPEAEGNFLKLAKVPERESDAAFYLGQIEESRDKQEAALARYQSVTTGSNVFPAQLRRAVLLASLSRLDEARTLLTGIKAEDQAERSQLALTHAEILVANERLDEAMAVYDQALNGVYDMALLYNRAMLAERMGKLDLLESDLKAVLAREPDNAQALNALGFTLADRTTRYEEARGLIEKALQVGPRDFYVLDSMGWVLFKLGQAEAAIPYLEEARKIRDDPEVAAHLGEVLWSLDRRKEAREVWNKALKQHPGQPKLLDTIKRLDP